jgi:hypothetical protein
MAGIDKIEAEMHESPTTFGSTISSKFVSVTLEPHDSQAPATPYFPLRGKGTRG